MPRMPNLSFRIPPEVKDALARAASNDQRSVSSLVLKILTDWLRQNGYLPASVEPTAAPEAPTQARKRPGRKVRIRSQE